MLKSIIFIGFFTLLVLGTVSFSAGTYVNITEPYNATVTNNGSIYLGKAGPGQTFSITVSALTTNGTGSVFSRGWNKLVVTGYPNGWIVKNSALYRSTLTVDITPSPEASNGTYKLALSAVNIGNYSKIGSLNFVAYVNITPNVFKMSVAPEKVYGSPGEPKSIAVTINNTGVSDSPFVINVSGIQGVQFEPETVIALHHTSETFKYAIFARTPGQYSPTVNVSSLESPLVRKSVGIKLNIKPSLLDDYYAIGQGSPIFPIIYEPSYVLMYVIGLLSKL
ncbi:MAG: hypothetical protein QW814_00485 [Methanothrix sp.]